MKKITWEKIEAKNLFTIRNSKMVDLDTKENKQYYTSNTKIQVVEQATVDGIVYYRTAYAVRNGLNWAIEASSFASPIELAPSAHYGKNGSKSENRGKVDKLEKCTNSISNSYPAAVKQTDIKRTSSSNDGGGNRFMKWFNKIRRKNGEPKNS